MCLDAEMKRLRNSGLGSKTKKAQHLSIEEEEILFINLNFKGTDLIWNTLKIPPKIGLAV